MAERSIERLEHLTADPENARAHDDRNLAMIADALREVGAARSIVIDEAGVILAGNGVVRGAGLAGIDRVRVVEADGDELIAVRRRGLTAAQKKRLALFDNRTGELSTWDPSRIVALLEADARLLDGVFTADELAALVRPAAGVPGADPGAQVGRAAELAAAWGTAPGQLWLLGEHRLACGDAESADDVGRLLGGARPALCLADPPYGVEYDPAWRDRMPGGAGRRRGVVPNDERADWRAAWALAPGDVLYCWHNALEAEATNGAIRSAGFEMRAQIVWSKARAPVSRGHYRWGHEPCWYAVRRGGRARWVGDRSQSTVWEIPADETADGGHATQKPVECFARPIRNHAGDVYAPFVGSGSALVAAAQLGRRCYALDVDPGYVAVCLERLAGMGVRGVLA